jgi:hypothetical protein
MEPAFHKTLALASLLALLAACTSGPSQPAEDEIERLRALGYVGFTRTTVDPAEQPVTLHDPQRSAPGLNLISNRDLTSAQLFDADGTVLREWKDEGANHWSNAELLPDGDLLVTGSEQSDATGSNFLLRMAWDGKPVWRAPINAHHDAELTPAGTIATLTFSFRRIPEVSERFEVKDHEITLLTPAGEVLEAHSLYDALCTTPEIFTCKPVQPKTQLGHTFVDLLHPNSIEFMRHQQLEAKHAIYAPSNVLVSFRHQDTIAILNWESRRVLWTWGRGEISAQHDATVLANGHILLFDNGVDRRRSRIVELDPLSEEIVWEYQAPTPTDFFSLRKGSNQRLENGNTLVANSDSGEAFEVTPMGEVVWHFLIPNTDEESHRATIVRIHRYPLEFIDGLGR